MTLARWQATIVDASGNVQAGASIEVRRETTGSPLATLYSDRDGVTPLGNPFTADSDGYAFFHVAGGAFRITATNGAFSRTWRYVGVALGSESDSGGGGASDFTDLGDVPSSYSGEGSKVVAVKSDESGLEFIVGGSGDNTQAAIHGASAKTTPVDADTTALIDSEDSNTLKKVTWANVKATLKTYFDTLYQPLASILTAIAALSSTGLIARTGSGTVSVRTITGPAAGITVSNGDGVSGNPTLALANDLSALEALSSTGIARRTGSDTWTVGTTVATAEITDAAVSNAKMANMAESTIKGRAAGAGTGAPVDLTATQATAILNAVVGDSGSGGTKGLVPAPGSGDAAAGKFLKADGTWATTPGGGGGAESFTDLDDVPASYSGQGGKLLAVTGAEDGVEFVVAGSGDNTATAIHAASGKTTPVDADTFPITDTEDSNAIKKVTFANLWVWVQAKFNGTAKASPVAADRVYIGDSAASNVAKYSTFTQIMTLFGALINGSTDKATPVDADQFAIADSAASNATKKLTFANLKAALFSLASTTEVLTGTDTAKPATPNAIAALWEKGSDIASSGTISIGEGGFFHVTGTTTITDIDFATAKDGRGSWLIFDDILTFTHHATTLKLPTGSNITTAAGDRCYVVQDSSDNAVVLVYQRADGTPLAGGGGTSPVGVHEVWVDATAMVPASSNGAQFTDYTPGSGQVHKVLAFDSGTLEQVYFKFVLPKSWNAGTITFIPYWTNTGGSSTQNVQWAMGGCSNRNDDAVGTGMGTAVTSNDTWLAQNDVHIGPESSAFTYSGTPQKGNLNVGYLYRAVDSDNMTGDALLFGILLRFTTDAATDA